MSGIEITRVDMSASDLRSASAKAPDARSARRMLALALVLEGVDRKTAAETCGMERQTLRDWVHRSRTACAPGATCLLISARCKDSISALACGRTRAAVARRAGQTAPKI